VNNIKSINQSNLWNTPTGSKTCVQTNRNKDKMRNDKIRQDMIITRKQSQFYVLTIPPSAAVLLWLGIRASLSARQELARL
jgi:hypothetical protein